MKQTRQRKNNLRVLTKAIRELIMLHVRERKRNVFAVRRHFQVFLRKFASSVIIT